MGVSNAHQSHEVAVSRARSPAPIRIIQRIRIIRRRYVSDCTVVTLLDRSAAASEQGGYAMIHILRGRALVHRAASFTASIKAGVFTTAHHVFPGLCSLLSAARGCPRTGDGATFAMECTDYSLLRNRVLGAGAARRPGPTFCLRVAEKRSSRLLVNRGASSPPC